MTSQSRSAPSAYELSEVVAKADAMVPVVHPAETLGYRHDDVSA